MATGNPFIDRAAELYGQIASGAAALPFEHEVDPVLAQRNRAHQIAAERNQREQERIIREAQERNRQVQAKLEQQRAEQREQDAAALEASEKETALVEWRRVGGSDKDFNRLWRSMYDEILFRRVEASRARQSAASQF